MSKTDINLSMEEINQMQKWMQISHGWEKFNLKVCAQNYRDRKIKEALKT